MLTAAIEFLGCVVIAGGFYALEHPQDPGMEPYPSIWVLTMVAALENMAHARGTDDYGRTKAAFWQAVRNARDPSTTDSMLTTPPGDAQRALRVSFGQCCMGPTAKGATTISSNIPDFASSFAGLRCEHAGGHPPARGRDSAGRLAIALAPTYPSKLCELLAREFVKCLGLVEGASVAASQGWHDEMRLRHAAFATAERDRVRKVPVPSIGPGWDPLCRWKEVLRVRWTRDEHQNVLELRALLLLYVQHVARRLDHWDRRVLVITDSKVAIGVAMKGQSRSLALNQVMRRLSSYLLATGITLYVRWVESHRNHADGPSRGFPKGQAPKEASQRVRLPGRHGVWIDGALVEPALLRGP